MEQEPSIVSKPGLYKVNTFWVENVISFFVCAHYIYSFIYMSCSVCSAFLWLLWHIAHLECFIVTF